MGRLAGNVAIVTGGGRGIGREHALLLGREGAQVVVNDVGCDADGTSTSSVAEDVAAQIRAAGGNAIANSEEIGTFEAAQRLMQAALDEFGRVDVLVNNAGILRDRTILKMSEEEWHDVLRVHLTGTFSCLQAAARIMKEQETGGRIINTSSVSGLLGNFGQANYGAAKAGIYALTRIAALELAKHRITVNAIAPIAMTRMLATIPGLDEEASREALSPARIAPLVGFLATPDAAAAGVNGMTFGIEGNHLFCYRMMATHGVTRHEVSPWTIEAIEASILQVMHQ